MWDNFQVDFLNQYRAEVDCALADFFTRQKFSEKEFGQILQYSALLGGKRFRPTLGLIAFELAKNSRTKISRQRALEILLSLELIHAFSLVHDDLPALDNDTLRRGKSTAWKKFGEANALLAGDALILLAFENLAAKSPPEILPQLSAILATASFAMTVGQFRDLDSRKNNSLQNILTTHSQKTGALIGAAVEMGAQLANANSATIKLLHDFAQKLGLAFQIKDDLLDALGDEKLLGKKVGKDLHKKGFVKALGIAQSEKKLAELIAATTQISQKLRSKKLEQLAEFVAMRKN